MQAGPSPRTTLFQRFTAAVGNLNWYAPARWIVGSIIGLLSGAGLLAFLSEYATYSYALVLGVRPPVEGIPYLRATVALSSIFLPLACAAVFLTVAFLLRVVTRLLWATMVLVFAYMLRSHGLSESAKAALTTAAIADGFRNWAATTPARSMLLTISGAAIGAVIARLEIAALPLLHPPTVSHSLFLTTGAVMGALMVLTSIRPSAVWWLGTLLAVATFVAWLIVLFTPTYYGVFLRVIGFGGGIPIVVQLTDEQSTWKLPQHNLYLVLRTTDALILFDRTANVYIEVPRDHIRAITHHTGGLVNLPHHLPSAK